MKKIIVSIVVIVFLTACNNKPENNPSASNPTKISKDTLPDSPRFVFTVDEKNYTIDATDIDVHYSSSDSTLTIDAGKKDADRLNITISDVKHVPGYRGNAWRSNNTMLAGSDSLIDQPSISFYKNDNGLASWNNLDDGYHSQEPKEDNSIHIYSLRQTGERTFVIKGRINTRVLKNVFESGSKDFNKDHAITAEFVIQFEDYWLQL